MGVELAKALLVAGARVNVEDGLPRPPDAVKVGVMEIEDGVGRRCIKVTHLSCAPKR